MPNASATSADEPLSRTSRRLEDTESTVKPFDFAHERTASTVAWVGANSELNSAALAASE